MEFSQLSHAAGPMVQVPALAAIIVVLGVVLGFWKQLLALCLKAVKATGDAYVDYVEYRVSTRMKLAALRRREQESLPMAPPGRLKYSKPKRITMDSSARENE